MVFLRLCFGVFYIYFFSDCLTPLVVFWVSLWFSGNFNGMFSGNMFLAGACKPMKQKLGGALPFFFPNPFWERQLPD